MSTISLEGLEFFSYHGYYAEEQVIGNKYSVDVVIEADISAAAEHDKIRETIDYVDLYKIVSRAMQERSRLLEHVALRIIQNIRNNYPGVHKITVSVSKFNPPIGGVCSRAKVTLNG